MTEQERLIKSGERIRQKRRQKNMNQSEFGEAIGLGKSSVSFIEAGKVTVSVDMYQKMSDVLECSVFELLCISGVKEDVEPAHLTASFEHEILHVLQKQQSAGNVVQAVEGLLSTLKSIVSDYDK